MTNIFGIQPLCGRDWEETQKGHGTSRVGLRARRWAAQTNEGQHTTDRCAHQTPDHSWAAAAGPQVKIVGDLALGREQLGEGGEGMGHASSFEANHRSTNIEKLNHKRETLKIRSGPTQPSQDQPLKS